MELKYSYYFGGKRNPWQSESEKAYEKLTEEREAVDPEKKLAIEEVFPTLDTWPEYVIAHSKEVFWLMERALFNSGVDKEEKVAALWEEAKSEGLVGEWLKQAEAEEVTKAMCYYMASLYDKFSPQDDTVNFRLYISEGWKQPHQKNEDLLEEIE